MTNVMPQEIEVWYLIPALRKEFARIFLEDYNLNQKKIAEILGVTESAISQYFKSKRGNEMKFSKHDLGLIKKSAEEIIKDNKKTMKKIYDLCILLRESKSICKIHKSHDKSISKHCDICFK